MCHKLDFICLIETLPATFIVHAQCDSPYACNWHKYIRTKWHTYTMCLCVNVAHAKLLLLACLPARRFVPYLNSSIVFCIGLQIWITLECCSSIQDKAQCSSLWMWNAHLKSFVLACMASVCWRASQNHWIRHLTLLTICNFQLESKAFKSISCEITVIGKA